MKRDPMTFGVLHLFAGIGGGALGFQAAREEWNGITGRFETLGGIDVDPEACADFTSLTGVPATQLDLFTREDYIAFHGREPALDWHEATPEDVMAASGDVAPDVIFTSAPCKGLSGLLPGAAAASPKYQALNRLTVRGIALALAAWPNNPPGLIIFENVPRITTRGAYLLAVIKALLTKHGYVLHDATHDMGELGGLSQRRRRYLLVARLPRKIPAFLYRPPQRKVRSIGEALGALPLPGDPAGGPMHNLPRLNWLTWVRLALIPAGGDWRDLQGIEAGQYRIVPASPKFNHIYQTTPWNEPFRVVTSSRDQAIADPRLGHEPRKGVYKVARWGEASSTVVASARPGGSNGVAAVADPRLGCSPRSGAYRVVPWDEAASTVTGAGDVHSQGAAAVADPRLPRNNEPGSWVIVALDGTWHRPLTTLELAVLQGFPTHMRDGSPLTLAGRSQARWRERIGNAVPPPAARAVAEMMLLTLVASRTQTYLMSVWQTAIWVRIRRIQQRKRRVGYETVEVAE